MSPRLSPKDACRHDLIAREGGSHVTRCEHGMVHVSLGAVSLRLSEEQFRGVARLFGEAAEALPAAGPVMRAGRPVYLC